MEIEAIKDLGGLMISLSLLLYGMKYFVSKNEELLNKIDKSHVERETMLIDLINKQNFNHNECTNNYYKLSSRLEEVIRNNTEAINEIREIVDK
jgi:hypothetical protein